MKQPNPPSDIAREAIRRLDERKLAPTPDNYRRVYAEVMGQEPDPPVLSQAIRELIKQWDVYQVGLTQAKKREMLERVLLNFGADPFSLGDKLANLAHSWSASGQASAVLADAAAPGPIPAGQALVNPGRLTQSLAALADAMSERWPDLAKRCQQLAARDPADLNAILDELDDLWREILLRAEDDHELWRGMRRLVALLFENMISLVGEDAWLSGQLASMRAILSGHLNYHALFEAEQGLQEIVTKQGRIRDNLQDAKEKLKLLITSFIDRVGEMSSSTGVYQERLAGYSQSIARADDIAELAEVVDKLSADMGDIQQVMRSSHEELVQARGVVESAERRIVALEKELSQVSSLVREDQLTGALNRRGLEETFVREAARAERMHAPLSLALLDIDHFKRLNDSLGHQAGDQALVHLANVVRQLLRPTDSLARWGGEEFLILLPNTGLDEATEVLRRLQRELTRKIFLHEMHKVLITFSAGVVQWRPGEGREEVVARADAAMYQAKSSGRNRVEQGT
jgi:diguanylate cyclase